MLALVVLAFVLRVWAPGPVTETYDERLWLARTDQYVHAWKTHDFDRATPASADEVTTMPGLTVMMAGAAGRAIAKASGRVGSSDPIVGPSVASPQVLRASRAVVAMICSVVLGLIVWVAASLVGRRGAAIAGVLLATEPFLVGHSGLLHTDAMVTMFGALSVLSLMAAVWAPGQRWRRGGASWPLVGASAAAGALAILTKLNAIPVLVPALVLIGLVEVRRRPGLVLRLVAGWSAAAATVFVALFPALWTSPMTQLRRMVVSAHLATHHVPADPWLPYAERHLFVPANLAVRMTPWMVGAGCAATVACAAVLASGRRRAGWPPRRVLAVLVLAPVPYLLLLERSPRVFDRYLLPLWPYTALTIGIAGAAVLARWRVRSADLRLAGAAATVVLAVATSSVAPYGTAYADPLIGPQRTERLVSLGWGEGVERLGQAIAQREGRRCTETVVAIRYPLRVAVPCGRLVNDASNPAVEYVVVEVRHRQRRSHPELEAVAHRGVLLRRVRIEGVSYAELWLVRDR